MTIPITHECWVCGAPVSLEECKVDEHGEVVHETCYVTKVARSKIVPVPAPSPTAI